VSSFLTIRSRVSATAVIALILLGGASSRAQPAPPPAGESAAATGDAEARRSALYRDGVELANAGRWEEAAARFREVVAIRSAPPALFSLGQAEEHSGRYASAKRAYARARIQGMAAGALDVAEAADKALTAVEGHVGHVTVKISATYADAAATIDDAPVTLEQPFDVDRGDHRVRVSATNRRPFTTTVRVAEGEQVVVAASLEAEPPPLPIAPPPAPRKSSGSLVGPVVLGSVGVAAAVAGLVVRQLAQSSYDDASAACPNLQCRSATDVTEGNDARTRILIGTVTIAGGIAVAAGALTWWLVTPKKREKGARASLGISPSPSGLRASAGIVW
jgi:hypothetical protein